MPYLNDEVLDQGLDYADTNGTRIDICSQEPLTDGSSILVATGDLASSQAVTSGNTFTLGAISITKRDPS